MTSLGGRVRVYWDADKRFYGGKVTQADGDKHTVTHDDGEVVFYRLKDEVWFEEQKESPESVKLLFCSKSPTGYKCVHYRDTLSQSKPFRVRIRNDVPWRNTEGFATAVEAAAHLATTLAAPGIRCGDHPDGSHSCLLLYNHDGDHVIPCGLSSMGTHGCILAYGHEGECVQELHCGKRRRNPDAKAKEESSGKEETKGAR